MALLGNYSVLTKSPMRKFSGTSESEVRSNWRTSGSQRNRQLQSDTTAALSKMAVPTGYYPSYTVMIPQVAGELGATKTVAGAATVSAANLAGGLNAEADLTGSGDITSAIAGLIVSAVATLTGVGTVAAADLRGFLNAVATVSGTGSLTAAIGALAWANAAITGGGTVSNATPYATGTLSSTIRSYGDLTPEGLRDAVWNALAASYNTAGTMGAKVNAAGSGGVDYAALGLAVWNVLKTDAVLANSMGELLNNVPDNVWNKTLP